MRNNLLCSIIALSGLLLGGCNNDIFVDPIPELEEDSYHLACGGDAVSFTIPTKGLKNVSFNCDDSPLAAVNCFDNKGEYIGSDNFSKAARISFFSPLFCLDFEVDGDKLTVKALDNTTPQDITVWMSLGYGHTYRFIDFVISPGKPLEIEEIYFNVADARIVKYRERDIPHSYLNNSDKPQRIVIYPFKEATSKIDLMTEDYLYWTKGAKGEVPIPFFSDDEWIYSESNVAEVTMGSVTSFYSPDLDLDETYAVEVAPNSKVTTITEMTYATLDVEFTGYLKQPNSGYSYYADGTCKLKQPVEYKIEKL